jgi:two-component system, OmpR family, alkaline phosphatase synthesis response regulator PhoP
LRKILIVDDEPYILNILDFSLDAEGYTVLQAADGAEALTLAIEHSPDLVIMDVMMPRLDGFDTCRKLKEDTRTNNIPVVLLTARSSKEDRKMGDDVKADGFITKPFSPQRLLDTVSEFLGVTSE